MTPERERARRVYLGLGSNIGDREDQLRRALDALRAGGVAIEAVSAIYDTAPWGVSAQPRFANIVAIGRTRMEPFALLGLAKVTEAAAGRDPAGERWSARPLDIDILLIEGEVVDSEPLSVPHVRMHERGFVLVPLVEVAPRARHPLFGLTAREMLEELPAIEREGIELIEPAGWYALD
ncbi:MAG: 2-amino-4-hydroxy-6-hydroxymethyldihydropteridine diphosphokinase [Dehalococcoidia bacterium]